MRRTWTKVGENVVGPPNDETTILGHDTVTKAIASIKWKKIPKEGMLSLAMGPGLAIGEAIRQLNIPKVSHIAISDALAPYGLYGIRGHYKNGDAEVFLVDRGTELIPICSDLYDKPERKGVK